MTGVLRLVSTIAVAGAMGACKVENKAPLTDTTAGADPAVTSSAQVGTSSVVGARIAVPHAGPPGEWQMPAGDYASSRYSELGTITPENVANLHVSWAFSTGVLRGHEGQPRSTSLNQASHSSGNSAPKTPSRQSDARAVMWSIAALRTRMENYSTIFSTDTPSRWTRQPGVSCGGRRWETCRAARRSPWRR